MTVAELITALQRHDPDMLVFSYDCDFHETSDPEVRENMHVGPTGDAYHCWNVVGGQDCHLCKTGMPKRSVVLL